MISLTYLEECSGCCLRMDDKRDITEVWWPTRRLLQYLENDDGDLIEIEKGRCIQVALM